MTFEPDGWRAHAEQHSTPLGTPKECAGLGARLARQRRHRAKVGITRSIAAGGRASVTPPATGVRYVCRPLLQCRRLSITSVAGAAGDVGAACHRCHRRPTKACGWALLRSTSARVSTATRRRCDAGVGPGRVCAFQFSRHSKSVRACGETSARKRARERARKREAAKKELVTAEARENGKGKKERRSREKDGDAPQKQKEKSGRERRSERSIKKKKREKWPKIKKPDKHGARVITSTARNVHASVTQTGTQHHYSVRTWLQVRASRSGRPSQMPKPQTSALQ